MVIAAAAALIAVTFDMFLLFAGIILGGAGLLLAQSAGIEFDGGQTVIFLTVLLAFPAAAFTAGALLDRFCLTGRAAPFSKLCGMIAAAALLSVGNGDEFLAALSFAGGEGAFVLFVRMMSSVFFCGCLTAFVVAASILLFEAVSQWLLHAFGLQKGAPITLHGLRTVLALTLLSWCINLISDFYWHELSPAKILAVSKD